MILMVDRVFFDLFEILHIRDYLAGFDHLSQQGPLICILGIVFYIPFCLFGLVFFKIGLKLVAVLKKLFESVGKFGMRFFIIVMEGSLLIVLGEWICVKSFLDVSH